MSHVHLSNLYTISTLEGNITWIIIKDVFVKKKRRYICKNVFCKMELLIVFE